MTAFRFIPSKKQILGFSCTADILIYGGAAGGGKSALLTIDPIRHTLLPDFNGIIFRRTFPQIFQAGGLWDETQRWYPGAGGTSIQQPPRWRFPSGAKIDLASIQHEKDVHNFMGGQFAYIAFDELTHFTRKMFFYLISRLRSMCGIKPYIRCSCNPEAGSWVADLISWWIDQETGYPIPDRVGVIRWFYQGDDDELLWYDSKEEAMAANPERSKIAPPKSLTFIPSNVTDNTYLMEKDPGYMANLLSLPKIERFRLLEGNWKIAEESIIDALWIRPYKLDGHQVQFQLGDRSYAGTQFQRFAIIDTAGTSKQKADEKKRGKAPSYTCCGIFDYHEPMDMLLWRDVWRSRVSWNELISQLPAFLDRWNVRDLRIENAHHGQALFDEMASKYQCRYVGPVIDGMATGTARGAKLERAVASGILQRFEFGTILISPDPQAWSPEYSGQLSSWTGLDDEVADLVDVASYASDVVKRQKKKIRVA